MPIITTVKFFINVPQFDMCACSCCELCTPLASLNSFCLSRFDLMYNTDNYAPNSPSQLSFVEEFQAGTLKLIASLPAGTGVFAPTCLVHCLSGQTTWSQLSAANTTMSQAVAEWYFNGVETVVVSDCIGWSCVNACGVNLWTGLQCNIGGPQGSGCTPLSLEIDSHGTTSTDTSGAVNSDELPGLMHSAQNLVHKPIKAPPAPDVLAGLSSAAEGLSSAETALFGPGSPLAQALATPSAQLTPASDVAAAPDLRRVSTPAAKLHAYWHREQRLADHWYRPEAWQTQTARRAHLAGAGCCGTDANGNTVPAQV